MKLPRWVVWVLLGTSLLACLLFGAWWWLTWPDRTTREFIALVKQGEFEHANELLVPPSHWEMQTSESATMVMLVGHQGHGFGALDDQWKSFAQHETVTIQPRTFLGILRGCRRFKLGKAQVNFMAKRGDVVFEFAPQTPQ